LDVSMLQSLANITSYQASQQSNQTNNTKAPKLRRNLESYDDQIYIDETNIAFSSDRNYKFKPLNPNKSWLDTTNEHVIVWY
jgi:hypothetical protein